MSFSTHYFNEIRDVKNDIEFRWSISIPNCSNFPLCSKRNDAKNRSIGVSSDFCGRYWTYLEPLPSLKIGKNTVHKDYLFKNLIDNTEIVKEYQCYLIVHHEKSINICPVFKFISHQHQYQSYWKALRRAWHYSEHPNQVCTSVTQGYAVNGQH